MEELNVHTISYLEACYDSQIPELRGLVEESIGDNLRVIKLVTKVLPIFEHHTETANGVCTDKYGGKNYLLGGAG